MARSAGVGLKKRREKQVTYQHTDRVYSRSEGSNYNTGMGRDATRRTTGIDKGGLLGNKQEKRGRKAKDAPIGKRKQHTTTEKQRVRSSRKNRKRGK